MIPGLGEASFARLGGIHRNTFIHPPSLLDEEMRLKAQPNLRFAGQITGVEGYVESAAMGMLAGRLAAAEILGRSLPPVPETTATGALVTHITGGAEAKTFQPMNVNFGLFPPVGRQGRTARAAGPLQGLYRPGEGGLAGMDGAIHAGRGGRRCLGFGPMGEKFLDKVYGVKTDAENRDLYDAWSATYDDEVTEHGYIHAGALRGGAGGASGGSQGADP